MNSKKRLYFFQQNRFLHRYFFTGNRFFKFGFAYYRRRMESNGRIKQILSTRLLYTHITIVFFRYQCVHSKRITMRVLATKTQANENVNFGDLRVCVRVRIVRHTHEPPDVHNIAFSVYSL